MPITEMMKLPIEYEFDINTFIAWLTISIVILIIIYEVIPHDE